VVGSTRASSAWSSPGSRSVALGRPAPGRRMRPGGLGPWSISRMPRWTVEWLMPDARATTATPPRPSARACAPASRRRCRSSNCGPSTANIAASASSVTSIPGHYSIQVILAQTLNGISCSESDPNSNPDFKTFCSLLCQVCAWPARLMEDLVRRNQHAHRHRSTRPTPCGLRHGRPRWRKARRSSGGESRDYRAFIIFQPLDCSGACRARFVVTDEADTELGGRDRRADGYRPCGSMSVTELQEQARS
jgi:hypothetical protein